MTKYEEEVINDIIAGNIDTITWDDINEKMNENKEELDAATRRIEELDAESHERSMIFRVK